jgi:hypothetical protein
MPCSSSGFSDDEDSMIVRVDSDSEDWKNLRDGLLR